MNRIILAYATENADLANLIDQQLGRIGIPFEHANGAVAKQIASVGEPVLLLVTDNFLKKRSCMEGLLPVLQGLAAENRLVAVLADGRNAEGQPVPTQLERMSHALHYMKYWQDEWLALSDRHQHASVQEKAALTAELNATRETANQMGDVITALREGGYLTWQQFAANDFEIFFQKFNLQDWHGQYKRLAEQSLEIQKVAEPVHLPEMPVAGGLLAPEPVEIFELPIPEPEAETPASQGSAMVDLAEANRVEEPVAENEIPLKGKKEIVPEVEQAVRDAWFWIEKGHRERGLELLQIALEQYPQSDWLKGEYQRAEAVGSSGMQEAEAVDSGSKQVGSDSIQEQVTNPQFPNSPNPQFPNSPIPQITNSPNPQFPNSPNNQSLVLITGATSGIGRATAEIFARNGYRLILTGRRVERLVELKNRFEAEFGSEILLLPFDVRDPGAVEAALTNLPESFQDIDILVNNAGLAKGLAPIHEGSLEHWETMIDTNLKGLLYVTRLVSPGMVRRRSGHIINLGSSAGKEAYPNGNVYCATKFAVDGLTKAMRFDLYAHNVRVSQISPGHVEETEFAITRFDGDAERAKIYNDFQPLKSSDVAEAIFFIATRPPHVNIQDLQLFGTQQASNILTDRSGR